MGWKSTKTLTREEVINKIEKELTYNIEKLNDDTLCNILEVISEDENSEVNNGYYFIIEK